MSALCSSYGCPVSGKGALACSAQKECARSKAQSHPNTIPIVGFYTRDTAYEEEAHQMKDSALSAGLHNVLLVGVENAGSWEVNCQQKARVMYDACSLLRVPFLYVDADARFNHDPSLYFSQLPASVDLGVHYFKGTELLTGTVYVNPTERARELLSCWASMVGKNRMWDQRTLAQLLGGPFRDRVNVWELPAEFTWIFDLSPKYYGKDRTPIITHYQASRRLRTSVSLG